MNVLYFIGGALLASALWMLFIKVQSDQRRVYQQALNRKSHELHAVKCDARYTTGYYAGRDEWADDVVDLIAENGELREKIKTLESANAFFREHYNSERVA